MGAFNTVVVPWKGPATSTKCELKVQFKYGDVWQHEYQVGDTLNWGGNDVGSREARRVVVDGVLEGEPSIPGVPEDFEVHIVNNKIDKVIPATGAYDFVHADDTFIILEDGQKDR
jgi:hypothetical protein